MWEIGRRTNGIAMMEIPMYDLSNRKRKNHERNDVMSDREREEKKKREKRKKEGKRKKGRERKREREGEREGEGRMTKLIYKSYELAAFEPSSPTVLSPSSATLFRLIPLPLG